MQLPRFIISSILLFTVPSLSVYPQADSYIAETPQEILDNLHLWTFDDILTFIDRIESEELDCSEADLERINYFLIHLARQGLLPGESEEALERDIQELLDEECYSYSFPNTPEMFLCRNWVGRSLHYTGKFVKTKSRQTVKFVKEHKKPIIIGTAVVVGGGLVVGVAAAISGGAAATAGAIASQHQAAHTHSHKPSLDISSPPDVPTLKAAPQEYTYSFKESLASEHFFEPNKEFSLKDNARVLGSLFAHESFKNLNQQFSDHPQPPNSSHFGHQEIDRKFSTDYAPYYVHSEKERDFTTFSYQMRGEKALASGHFNQAVHDFGKAIELDPAPPLPYLHRGIAHLGLGHYESSLKDYEQYTAQTKQTISIPGFSLGFAKGLPQGIYDSGSGIFLLISDLVTRPIHTGGQMWEALSLLSNLAKTEQWGVVAEVLAPEVHQLVKEWDTLSSETKGELAGYAFGKYGADIIIPGALAKAVSKGLKGAQELSLVYKGFQSAEQTLLLESVASLENAAKIGDVLQASQKTVILGEELGLTAREMAHLKQAGTLESTVASTAESMAHNPIMRESTQRFKYAKDFLEPHLGKYMPEAEAKTLIQQAGIPTFSRPPGIPENYLVSISDKGAGIKYVDPKNTHVSVRVMPGQPHSQFQCQQKSYVIQLKEGKAFDKLGNRVSPDSPAAHIPIEEFIYRD